MRRALACKTAGVIARLCLCVLVCMLACLLHVCVCVWALDHLEWLTQLGALLVRLPLQSALGAVLFLGVRLRKVDAVSLAVADFERREPWTRRQGKREGLSGISTFAR